MHKYLLILLSILNIIYCPARAQAPGAGIDVQHYTFALQLNDINNIIKGQATITARILKNTAEIDLDLVKSNGTGKGMLVSAVTENGQALKFKQDSDNILIFAPAQAGSQHSYQVRYAGIPADGLIISTNNFGQRTFFGDNWPNRAHNWLPCIDNPADKAPVEFIITAPDHYQVVANGSKVSEEQLPGHLKLTHWKETASLPTKVMVIGVARFAVDHPGDVGDIPVYTYVFPGDKTAGFKSYAVAQQILPFFIKKIGPYSYEKLANVQSKTIFGGMENASAIFYYEGSVNDPGIEALMAHEIAHQWFGDAVSEKSWPNLWLSEGFATYMASVYLEDKYGPDTLKSRMAADRKKVLAFEKRRLTPVVDTTVKSNYMQLLNANSYEKGSWVLHMLRHKLGDEVFWKGIRNYYAAYKGANANTSDFEQAMEQAGGQNLEPFFNQWLRRTGHPELNIAWHYDTAKSIISFVVEQNQAELFNFQLDYDVDGVTYTATIKNKINNFYIPVKAAPVSIVIDSDVKLLASFNFKTYAELMLKHKVN